MMSRTREARKRVTEQGFLRAALEALDATLDRQADAFEVLACELTDALCPVVPAAPLVLGSDREERLLALLTALEEKQGDLAASVSALALAVMSAHHGARPCKG